MGGTEAAEVGTEAAEAGTEAAEAGTGAAEAGTEAAEVGNEAAEAATEAAEAGTEDAEVGTETDAAALGAELGMQGSAHQAWRKSGTVPILATFVQTLSKQLVHILSLLLRTLADPASILRRLADWLCAMGCWPETGQNLCK